MELQELIARGRFAFARAGGRLKVFELVSGRRSAKEIAKTLKRDHASALHDLRRLKDLELIQPKPDGDGNTLKKDGSVVYEKSPLARQIPLSYFHGPVKLRHAVKGQRPKPGLSARKAKSLTVPSEIEILDLCKAGEDEVAEFKAAGTETRKITKEIAAFLHTRQGGLVYYGVEDDGTIAGTDIPKPKLDQQVQNSVRNTISPAPHVLVKSVKVMGTEILLILVPPWNRRKVYFYEGRVYVRKGTNVFEAKPEEIKQLHNGEHIA